jgi:site-specific recombinase XerD
MDLIRLRKENVLLEAEVLISHVVPSNESKRAYRRAIRELIDWCEHRNETGLDKAAVSRYRSYLVSRNLAPATINQKLSAIRMLAIELSDGGRLSPAAAAAIARVKGVKSRGIRMGHWLTGANAERLLDAPDTTCLKGKRDCALLGVAFGCGLRRQELANLKVETIQERSDRWVLVDIRGKHGRIRSIPMPSGVKDAVDAWLSAAGIRSGNLFRAITKNGRIHGDGVSAQAIYEIIKGYGVDIGVTLAPHDLRRSFARLAHAGKSPLEQIQLSLGHASVATTERYIGARQDLYDAPCDRLGISFPRMACQIPVEAELEEFPTWFLPPGRGVFRATGFMRVRVPDTYEPWVIGDCR